MLAQIKLANCECGNILVFVGPDEADIASTLQKKFLGFADVIILNTTSATCSQCQRTIPLPAGETLDADRHPLGRTLTNLGKEDSL